MSTSNASKKKEGKRSVSDTFNLKDIGSLLELLDKHEVTEFKLERESETLWLKRGDNSAQTQAASTAPIHQVFTSLPQQPGVPPQAYDVNTAVSVAQPVPVIQPQVAAAPEEPEAKKSTVKEITSPMVGTFYRRAAVDSDPYVSVGDKVKKGDILCIVEAMKLMNEIESEEAGTIVEICLEDGQMVEFGEPLFRIEPL